ncbi:MAG TPA: multidrug efflux RND transporter permease subunit [Gemmataceae bacterium]|nr:multidrug efflux RND transporter permease subunit [Gemmataceae bacterium]
MISRFFIDRPIFAAVLSIVITLAGAISVFMLPLAQFPQITPPTVQVTANYPGASAEEVAEAVAAPIEQQVNGVEGMMYMSSQCANDGSYNLTVTFEHGVDLNMAQVLVQNRVSLAMPSLPQVIKQAGVVTRKRSPDILMGFALSSPHGRYNQLYLSNYALIQVKDELLRVPGVSDVFLLGQRDYSMRIWVDPAKLAARNLMPSDVVRALREQNAPVAAGAIGQQPAPAGQQFQTTIDTLGRLREVEQFENIIVKRTPDRRLTRLKDVARVKLGAKNQDVSVNFDDQETIFLAVFQTPDANALDVHERVLAKMEELSHSFPRDIAYNVAFDTTPYTAESINEVFKTLRDAILLVAVVVLVFLQNWRSALIPLMAVPVAIVGTFAVMAAIGFSLNNLTLFGLVLAIGIVVDDAIVVVEAVEHHIENGLGPREATIKAMSQVSGPVIAVGLVLSAVFVPCAFIGGITGQFFRQFALTIAVSTLISAFNSLTLSPALTALLLRSRDKETAPPLPRIAFAVLGGWLGYDLLVPRLAAPTGTPAWLIPLLVVLVGAVAGWFLGRPVNRLLSGFFRLFNAGFRHSAHAYTRAVGLLLRVSAVVLVVYGGLLALTYAGYHYTHKGFIPSQDMGYLLLNVQLPDSASTERAEEVMAQVKKITSATPGVKHVTVISGQSFALNAAGSNFGSLFVGLDDYPDRRDPSLYSETIAANLQRELSNKIFDAQVAVFGPPPVRGVGRAGGFALMVEDRGDLGPPELQTQTANLVGLANDPNKAPGLTRVFSVFRANVPMLRIEPDARACMSKGVDVKDYSDTLGINEGSLYVNDINLFGRTWQVIVQADARFRQQPEDLAQLKVRNKTGGMVPLGSLTRRHEVNGPLVLTRYNMYRAAAVNGAAMPGVSSYDAITAVQQLADKELPRSMTYEWTDMSYLELQAGNTAMTIFAFSVVMVFLVLAALYESWSLPLAVILVVPMCLLSAIVGVNIADMDINIFTQIGFVVLVGLASKNAILIVEFAKLQREAGSSRRDATLEAVKLRLRPIIMTSFAFILGVLPLIISRGAGAEMRRTLGTAVFSGMLGVTLFGIFLTPVFFYTIDWLGESRLFASPLVRRTSAAALGVLTLKPVFRLGGRLRQRLAAPRRTPVPREPVKQK